MATQSMVTMAEVQYWIMDMKFPASRRQILESAYAHGVPDEMIRSFENLPQRMYHGPQEIVWAINGIESDVTHSGEREASEDPWDRTLDYLYW